MPSPEELASEMLAMAAGAKATAQRGVMRAGLWMEGQIKTNASGRPGPNAPTGNYRRTWTTNRVGRGPTVAAASVGTNAPQGRRLEYGFVGVDSLGRRYNQRPYPHVEPAMGPGEQRLLDELADDFGDWGA